MQKSFAHGGRRGGNRRVFRRSRILPEMGLVVALGGGSFVVDAPWGLFQWADRTLGVDRGIGKADCYHFRRCLDSSCEGVLANYLIF